MERQTDNLTDHDLLIRIDERQRKMERCLREHLGRHWTVTLTAIGAGLTAVATLVVVLIRG